MALALFDLDHTLLDGDSDLLWCDFLIAHGLLDESFRERKDVMAQRYREGTVTPATFCSFFAATLAGRDAAHWLPWRERFLHDEVRPRIPAAARSLLQSHREAGDTLVLTTATNRLISEMTAADLGFEHHIATELELADGRFTGHTRGTLNMRMGKVDRLHEWLPTLGLDAQALRRAWFYSDSINDLPLLSAVGRPVAVDPDDRLLATARRRGWHVMHLHAR